MAIGTIGKYERLDVLGHGTSGVVYLAWDTLLRRQVALKEIRAAAPEMDRVLHEARVLDRLRHPNIVAVHSVDRENGAVLIDMELVRGKNLADVLSERSGNPLPVAEAARIVLDVLDALAYAHERRILHRDIKPANILIGHDGAVKLTDFGLAEALGSHSVAVGGGTYPYMAPEDFAEQEASDYRSDLWAMGVVLYEMLTGRRPFILPPGRRANDPFAWQRVIENENPPPASSLRAGLPPVLDAVLTQALAKDKSARFPTARAFADRLRAALPEATVSAPKAPPPAAPAGPFRFADGAVIVETLDELLIASVKHWDEARRALLDGRLERWLRGIGEIYIAEMAGELAAREGADADDRLREFLDRSGLDLTTEARQRAVAAEVCRSRGDHAGAEALLTQARRLVPEGPPPRLRRIVRRWENDSVLGEAGTVIAPAAAIIAPVPPAPVAAVRRREPSRWWFWPLLALCLAPPAVVIMQGLAARPGGDMICL